MSHHGPMFETQDITGWTARDLTTWIMENPGWADAEIKNCSCEICGDVTELVCPAGVAAVQEARVMPTKVRR